MTEPVWLTLELVVAIHDEQLRLFGGPAGLRDPGTLESALGRPKNKWAYENVDLAGLAAAYAFGIARNHAFVDGNKRAAFMAMIIFLEMNGVAFAPDTGEAAAAIVSLAAGEIAENGLARWIRDNWPK